VVCLLLGYCGGHEPDEKVIPHLAGFQLLDSNLNSFVWLSRVLALYYFVYFLVITPLLGFTETPLAVPDSISTPVLSGAAKDKVPTPTSPALLDLPVEINDDPQSAAIAADLHLTNVKRVPITAESPVQPLVDLSTGKTDAAIVWAPLAGAGMIELALEDKINIFSVDRPKDPPPPFSETTSDSENACAAAIADDIDSFGVLPAELLVPVHLRAMLNTPTPVFKMENAEKGQVVFQRVCARCHGQYAIRDPTLAPVDLLVSIRRFQFIGFKYIVMNGRSQKGMPPLRGTVSERQIALVFQYLQARSKGLLKAGTTTAAAK